MGRTTGEELFHVLDTFFVESGLAWTQCVGVCTDGAAAMTGRKSGVVAPVKQVAPHIASTHCMIHREALATKDMNEDLAYVFSTCVKIVNFIKARPLNHRLFENVPRNGSRTQTFVARYRSQTVVTRSRCAACL